ncbi:MAG: hypothetical protein IJS81_08380 [Selenomonadaceae bacterium]|nr:hypothetical protein [Selenomonadaceae bacterium]MBQ7630210.1 hypothetical protein [Selenomonadaceae bacterium]
MRTSKEVGIITNKEIFSEIYAKYPYLVAERDGKIIGSHIDNPPAVKFLKGCLI